MRRLKGRGFRVGIVATADPKQIMQQVEERDKQSGGTYVPPGYVESSFYGSQTTIAKAAAFVDFVAQITKPGGQYKPHLNLLTIRGRQESTRIFEAIISILRR